MVSIWVAPMTSWTMAKALIGTPGRDIIILWNMCTWPLDQRWWLPMMIIFRWIVIIKYFKKYSVSKPNSLVLIRGIIRIEINLKKNFLFWNWFCQKWVSGSVKVNDEELIFKFLNLWKIQNKLEYNFHNLKISNYRLCHWPYRLWYIFYQL